MPGEAISTLTFRNGDHGWLTGAHLRKTPKRPGFRLCISGGGRRFVTGRHGDIANPAACGAVLRRSNLVVEEPQPQTLGHFTAMMAYGHAFLAFDVPFGEAKKRTDRQVLPETRGPSLELQYAKANFKDLFAICDRLLAEDPFYQDYIEAFRTSTFPCLIDRAKKDGLTPEELRAYFSRLSRYLSANLFNSALRCLLVNHLELSLSHIEGLLITAVDEMGWAPELASKMIRTELHNIQDDQMDIKGSALYQELLARIRRVFSGPVKSIVAGNHPDPKWAVLKQAAQTLLLMPSLGGYGYKRDLKNSRVENPFPHVGHAEYPGMLFPTVSFDFAIEFLRSTSTYGVRKLDVPIPAHPLLIHRKLYHGLAGEHHVVFGAWPLLREAGFTRAEINDDFIHTYLSRLLDVDREKRLIALPHILRPGPRYVYHGCHSYASSRLETDQEKVDLGVLETLLSKWPGILSPDSARICLSSDPVHSRRFGPVVFKISVSRLIEQKVREAMYFRSFLQNHTDGHFRQFLEGDVFETDPSEEVVAPVPGGLTNYLGWGVEEFEGRPYQTTNLLASQDVIERIMSAGMPSMLQGPAVGQSDRYYRLGWMELKGLRNGRRLEESVMGLPIDFFRSVLGPTAGSKDVSLAEARYLGYQNGTLNYSEMEIDIGFLPQFLSFRSVEAIFMPQYVFDLLQQHGITKIINGTKIAPTLAGEIAIITYTDNFIEAVSQTRP